LSPEGDVRDSAKLHRRRTAKVSHRQLSGGRRSGRRGTKGEEGQTGRIIIPDFGTSHGLSNKLDTDKERTLRREWREPMTEGTGDMKREIVKGRSKDRGASDPGTSSEYNLYQGERKEEVG